MNPTKNNNLGTFTNRIKDLRLLNRYTQDHVASVLGIPRTVYLNVEQGNRDLKLKEARILASLYDMSIDELTYGTSTKNNNLPEPEHHKLANEGELREKLINITVALVHKGGFIPRGKTIHVAMKEISGEYNKLLKIVEEYGNTRERQGELHQIKILQHWQNLHGKSIEPEDLQHVIKSLERLPEQPLARETLDRLSKLQEEQTNHPKEGI